MTYIDVAIYAVPTANKDAFIAHSKAITPLFTEHGALAAVDCWGADVQEGEITSLPMAVKLEPGETVAYSHIIWPSKAAREAGMPKVMEAMQGGVGGEMPFDGKRMIFGGFETVIEA